MRIIAGSKRGLKLFAPMDDAVRPTTDRVKEAMFGSLQFQMVGAVVLDLFTGSGALGLEAVSRGAKNVVFVDSDAQSIALLKRNLEHMGSPENVEIVKNDFTNAIKLFQNSQKFDIVFVDPPYDSEYYGMTAELLHKYRVLAKNAVIIMESDKRLTLDIAGIEVVKEKKYGATFLTYCRMLEG